MSIILPIVWALIFLFIIWKSTFFTIEGISKNIIIGTFGIKLIASVFLHVIYTYYYTNETDVCDILKYYGDAKILFASIHDSVFDFFKILFGIDTTSPYFEQTDYWSRLYNYGYIVDNRTIIRANMIVMLLSFGYIGVHYVFADFISFFGYFLIFKAIHSIFPKVKTVFFFVFLMPSAILWTSAMLKEVLVILGLGFTLYGMVATSNIASWKNIVCFIIGIIILLGIKLYVLVALLPAVTSFLLVEKGTIRPWLAYCSICILGIVLLGFLDFGTHTIPFFESFAGKRNDFINTAIVNNAGSYLPIGKITATPWYFIKETPVAIWNGLALPYLWAVKNPLQILPAFESLLLFVLMLLTTLFFKKPSTQIRNFIWFCCIFSLVLIWEIGISTPVVGGIVRYKIPIFPFLYTTFAMLIDWDKIIQRFKQK